MCPRTSVQNVQNVQNVPGVPGGGGIRVDGVRATILENEIALGSETPSRYRALRL
jgi:hypothetical protein